LLASGYGTSTCGMDELCVDFVGGGGPETAKVKDLLAHVQREKLDNKRKNQR